MKRKRRGRGGFLWVLLIVAAMVYFSRYFEREPSPEDQAAAAAELDALLAPDAGVVPGEGLAAAILIDVSGSMAEEPDGSDTEKIVSAKHAALDLVDQFARYAADHPDERVLLGIYEFSQRDGQPPVRQVVSMGAPDPTAAQSAVAGMEADGGTPIGSAMVRGKQVLDTTGLSRRHLLVVTDGENTDDPDPADVAAAIARRPSAERPSIYFIAFDIAADRFDAVRDAGGLVLEASDGRALSATLDSLLRGEILVEQ